MASPPPKKKGWPNVALTNKFPTPTISAPPMSTCATVMTLIAHVYTTYRLNEIDFSHLSQRLSQERTNT